jgi:hypothetical protein
LKAMCAAKPGSLPDSGASSGSSSSAAVSQTPPGGRMKAPTSSPSNAAPAASNLKPPVKAYRKVRCSRCGSKRHASWRCAEIVRKCARCSNPNNTQHCHIVVMRTRLMKNFRDRYPSIIIQKLISLILNQHNYYSSVLCLGHTKVSLCTCVHPLSIELVDVTAQ